MIHEHAHSSSRTRTSAREATPLDHTGSQGPARRIAPKRPASRTAHGHSETPQADKLTPHTRTWAGHHWKPSAESTSLTSSDSGDQHGSSKPFSEGASESETSPSSSSSTSPSSFTAEGATAEALGGAAVRTTGFEVGLPCRNLHLLPALQLPPQNLFQ